MLAPVAQMDRAADFESVGREFESPQARHSWLFAPSKITRDWGRSAAKKKGPLPPQPRPRPRTTFGVFSSRISFVC